MADAQRRTPGGRRITHGNRESTMDYSDIKGRIVSLRGELAEVAEQNRKYFSRKSHSREEQAQHRLLQDRVRLIRAELQALVERTGTA